MRKESTKKMVHFRKLSRTTKHRKAMFRNMVTSLIHHERIKTTVPKAKELKRFADKMVTLGKRPNSANLNAARAFLRDELAVHKLFNVLGPRYEFRQGGYCRILRIGHRQRDKADMAFIEYVDREGEIRQAKPPSGKPSGNVVDSGIEEVE